ncbi:uncharacterized protein LOC127281446 [Leptopilina boulardi]|uniref:uncharacterized protein LOC127281446 n=1 Tax=Leptopilina boulardi TaxID=63433 RepID=UPI0021F57E26|nr:uncharacterized protein LOC127281446 [Leptopilina boulardi]XP_051161120.1 uncharacterized protein LOC127281446 [Leptopilina boulardi]
MPTKVLNVTTPSKFTKKKKIKERKKRKVKSKGWLETPDDWARFDAWAAVNAQPRKIPEPLPIIRETRPLSQFKKRIKVLSFPMKKTDESGLELGVSKAALKAKPSKRIKKLAKFTFKETVDVCREIPIKIRKATLRYEPTTRIIELSRPLIRIPEECKALEVSQKALKHETTDRERMMALSKKAVECPHFLLTDEEKEMLMTPAGIMKSALIYEFTPWMSLLSLPSYRNLKDRNDKNAQAWKKKIIEESELRGKKALEEKLRKKQKMIKKKEEEFEFQDEEIDQKSLLPEEAKDEEIETQEKGERKRKRESSRETDNESEEAKRRKIERDAWRFAPSPFQEIGVKQSALKAIASPRVKELSKANVRKSQAYWENPFEVSKSALSASASARILEMSNPINPRDPVDKSPPREKDNYGRPIFPMPAYGKVLPEVKYKKSECKNTEKNNNNNNNQQAVSKKRSLNAIVFESSIDPYLDSQRAKIQKSERRKLAQMENKSDSEVT